MMEPAIKVTNLGKRYRLGEHIGNYQTLRDSIAKTANKVFSRLTTSTPATERKAPPTIWALRDVSFQVGRGEVVGIIGRNGAGKTTLLKVLSRITPPTRGQVELRGEVGSLLEVGTGFHPELSGRENIYLNGAILGMARVDIARKFDEIVEFAEVRKFIDTPVKRYSSGMATRLAFSVAAHMEPEILLVDEVLAVGDLAFQKRCIGKMSQVAEAGRTILFVSHNMQAVRNLCQRTILIEEGRVACDAPTPTTIDRFNELLRTQKVSADTALHHPEHRRGNGSVRFTSVEILNSDEEPSFNFRMNDSIIFRLSFEVFSEVDELKVVVGLRSSLTGDIVTTVRHTVFDCPAQAGTVASITVELPEITIRPGQYPLYFWLGDDLTRPFDVVDDLTAPLVVSIGPETSDLGFVAEAPIGYFSIPSRVLCIDL